jgi:hypothetical protein
MITKARINAILRIWTEQIKNKSLHFASRRSNFKPIRPLKISFREKVDSSQDKGRSSIQFAMLWGEIGRQHSIPVSAKMPQFKSDLEWSNTGKKIEGKDSNNYMPQLTLVNWLKISRPAVSSEMCHSPFASKHGMTREFRTEHEAWYLENANAKRLSMIRVRLC